ncbi:MAG: anaerobic ribonucleoside-triphosphate reductase activating protein [Holosporaceae bacterium]|jgi:anaerobic ribonucleoside-triphosphate reductase activating protein|nr:anaerobic ribonucleoside-triphosphate reductase activating protein [Holosporaceae bacterium]
MNNALFVGGIVPMTTVDYPDHISAVIFMQGCPWRCIYCHNPHLQSILLTESLPWEDILGLLRERIGFIEAVVFSGGEPLAQSMLPMAIADVKRMGFLVGLHTAGTDPHMLTRVIPLVNWIGFDVKHSFGEYHLITGVKGSGETARRSLEIVISSNIDFEVRITLHESIEMSLLLDLFKELSDMGVKKLILQKCRDKDEFVVEHPIFSDRLILEDVSKYFDNFYIR